MKHLDPPDDAPPYGSPPVRGAWIETYDCGEIGGLGQRRPPCGGRGLKLIWMVLVSILKVMSPPVRGAWIETRRYAPATDATWRRPPCGGRGLKPVAPLSPPGWLLSPPVRGAWIETIGEEGKKLEGIVAPRAGGVD